MVFENIPFPPSTNQLYAGKSRRHKSTKYKNWQHDFLVWSLKNKGRILATQQIILEHFFSGPENFLKLGIELNVPSSIIFTKTGQNKKIDATNFIKALLDCVADELGIDDNRFFLSNCEFVCYDNLDICPNVTITFDKYKLRVNNHGEKKEKESHKKKIGHRKKAEHKNRKSAERHATSQKDPKTKWFGTS